MNLDFTTKHKAVAIFCVAMIIVMAYSVVAQYINSIQVPSEGTIGEIETTPSLAVFWDDGLSEEATLVDWGIITPEEPVTKTLYLYNQDVTPLILYFYVANWTPAEAENVVNITWNRENVTLKPKETIDITLTATCGKNPSFIQNFKNILHFGGEYDLT